MGYGRVRASRAVDITPPPTRSIPAMSRLRFIYFRGVNERDAGYCTPPSAAGATSFLRSICRDAIFVGVYTGNL